MLDVQQIKKDFPIFTHHPDLVYLDSASTSLKPKVMIDKIVEYYSQYSANIKRGIYKISELATEEYEATRQIVADFINAAPAEIIFTRNTTESLNLVAYALGRQIVSSGDEVVVSVMEHHSNFVPWQQLAFEAGADFKVIGVNEDGQLAAGADLAEIITLKTKILALTSVSNALGSILPIKQITTAAKKINPHVIVVIDAAQHAPHMKLDVQNTGADFVAFSAHKMLGPTGVGVLWGRKELLDTMFPFQYGGEMIYEVKLQETTFAPPPEKFEAGTPSIAEVIAFKEAIKYLQQVGFETIKQHEDMLAHTLLERLTETFGKKLTIFGPPLPKPRSGVVAFSIKGTHPHDLAAILDKANIAIRAGHHCTMPLHDKLDTIASARASFYLYNGVQDVERLVIGLHKAEKILT